MDMVVELCDDKRMRVSDVLNLVKMNSLEDMDVEQLHKTIEWLEKK